jgi:hypothetical protein
MHEWRVHGRRMYVGSEWRQNPQTEMFRNDGDAANDGDATEDGDAANDGDRWR